MSEGIVSSNGIVNGFAYGANFAAFARTGVQVDPGSTANTKGAWTQLCAGADTDVASIILTITVGGGSSAIFCHAVDIGVGGSGSEQVVISNLVATVNGTFQTEVLFYHLPISIPAGTRISARSQCDIASQTGVSYVMAHIFDGAMTQPNGGGGAEALGFNTATTRGTTVVSGAGTPGSVTEIISATTRDYAGFAVMLDNNGGVNENDEFGVDIFVGPSGSEQFLVPSIYLSSRNHKFVSPNYMIFIPAGTRISARASNIESNTDAANLAVLGIFK